MLNPELLFLFIIAVLLIVGILSARNFNAFAIALLLVVIPISGAIFMPRSTFGITGMNPVNVVWLAAFAITVVSGRITGTLREYLTPQVMLFMAIYFIAWLRTFFDIGSITQYEEFVVSRASLIIGDFMKPLQLFLVGWLVFVFCRKSGGTQVISKAIMSAAIVLGAIVLALFLKGTVISGSYTEGRQLLTASMGMHANSLGAIGVYFLIFMMRASDKVWAKVRLIAIGAALLLIVLSFSRIAYLATLVLFLLFYRKLPTRERKTIIVVGILVVAIFSADVISRIQWGINDQDKGHTVDAGRIHGIWLPLLPQVAAHPIFGSGRYGILKSEASRRGLHVNTPHSAYLEIVLDMGFIGLFLFFFIMYRWFKGAKRINSDFAYLIPTMLFLGLTGHSFYPYVANYMFFVGYGLYCYQRSVFVAQRRIKMAKAAGMPMAS